MSHYLCISKQFRYLIIYRIKRALYSFYIAVRIQSICISVYFSTDNLSLFNGQILAISLQYIFQYRTKSTEFTVSFLRRSEV